MKTIRLLLAVGLLFIASNAFCDEVTDTFEKARKYLYGTPQTENAPVEQPLPPAASNQVQDTGTTIAWGTTAEPSRGKNGTRTTYYCPAGGSLSDRLWGTDLYTDDSSICTAAVHAGLVTTAAGGTVTVEIRPGAASYSGTSRNGVGSRGYGGWHGSFVFIRK